MEWRAFENACSFSIDRQGRILARDTGDLHRKRARRDRVLDPSGKVLLEKDLGHYDRFNHYVRLDGEEELYFLRGSPPSSHEAKRLCGIDLGGSVRERMVWDQESEHSMEGCAAFGPRRLTHPRLPRVQSEPQGIGGRARASSALERASPVARESRCRRDVPGHERRPSVPRLRTDRRAVRPGRYEQRPDLARRETCRRRRTHGGRGARRSGSEAVRRHAGWSAPFVRPGRVSSARKLSIARGTTRERVGLQKESN